MPFSLQQKRFDVGKQNNNRTEGVVLDQNSLRVTPEEWQIICDFDGTITPFDVTDAVLSKFALPEWEAIEDAWVRGDIDARECMERQVALIRASQADLDAFLDTIPVDPGFKAFVSYCKQRGFAVRIVSDGMDYAIQRVLTRHGLRDLVVSANHLVVESGGRYHLEFPYGAEGCGSGVCKCRIAKAGGKKTLLIGDGRSDCCLAGNSQLVFAKKGKELLRLCQQEAYPHLPYNTFSDICAVFKAWEQ